MSYLSLPQVVSSFRVRYGSCTLQPPPPARMFSFLLYLLGYLLPISLYVPVSTFSFPCMHSCSYVFILPLYILLLSTFLFLLFMSIAPLR